MTTNSSSCHCLLWFKLLRQKLGTQSILYISTNLTHIRLFQIIPLFDEEKILHNKVCTLLNRMSIKIDQSRNDVTMIAYTTNKMNCVCLISTVDVKVDVSRPLKVNFSFVKLDQVNHFLEKIMKTGTCPQPETSLTSDELIPSDETFKLALACRKDPGTLTQETSKSYPQPEEGMWRFASFFQKITLQTTQVFLSFETVPHPNSPCILASFSDLEGCLSIQTGSKVSGKFTFFK